MAATTPTTSTNLFKYVSARQPKSITVYLGEESRTFGGFHNDYVEATEFILGVFAKGTKEVRMVLRGNSWFSAITLLNR